MTPERRKRCLTEGLFWIAFLSIVLILTTGGFEFFFGGVRFRFYSLQNPILYLLLFLTLHLIVAREEAFSLAGACVRGIERWLRRTQAWLVRVHWLARLGIFLGLVYFGLWELARRPVPGPMRVMRSQQGQSVQQKTFEDCSIDFSPPRLRRDFYEADRLEIQWTGYLYVPYTGDYRLGVEGDGIQRLEVAGQTIVEVSPDWAPQTTEGSVVLREGSHPFTLTYRDIGLQSTVRLLWRNEGGGWEPVPPWHLTRRPINRAQFLSLQHRAQFRPPVLLLCVFWVWHFTAWGFEFWQGRSIRTKRWIRRFLLAGFLLLAFGLRMYFLVRTEAMTHADEAVVGLMAKHIAEGRAYPLIYYDQRYNGTFLSYVLAPLFLVFGATPWCLKLVTCLLSVALVGLIYHVAFRWFGEEAALIASFLAALAPVMCVAFGLMALVGPIEGVVLSFVLLAVSFPLIFSDAASRRRFFLAGVLGGFGMWLNFQSLYYLLPVGLYLGVLKRRSWRRLLGFLGGGVLGVAPLLVYNVQSGFSTFRRFMGNGDEKDFFEIIQRDLIETGLPNLLGSQVRWAPLESIPPKALAGAVGLIFTFALFALVLHVARTLLGSQGLARFAKEPAGFLLVFFLGVLGLYLFSGFGEYHPRYLFSTFPMVLLLLGWWIARWWKRCVAVAALLFCPLALQNAVGNWKVDPFYFSQPVHYVERGLFLPQRNTELIETLRREALTRLHCDYWIGYSLAFESREAVMSDCDRDRYPLYRQAFLDSERPAYLFHNHDLHGEFYADLFEQLLGYERREIPPYVVFVPSKPAPPRSAWRVQTGRGQETAARAVDGDLSHRSRWETVIELGSAQLEIDLGSEQEIEQVVLLRGFENVGDATGEGLARGQLFLSTDQTHWQLQPPPSKELFGRCDRFELPRQTARYLKIVNRPEHYPYRWRVYSVFVQ